MLVAIGERKILLTGDARGTTSLAGWKAAGHATDKPVHLDILKIPHHGSNRNITREFLELFPAEHYVISADGKHSNPDVSTLRAMAETLGNRPYIVHFTNHTPAMKASTRRSGG